MLWYFLTIAVWPGVTGLSSGGLLLYSHWGLVWICFNISRHQIIRQLVKVSELLLLLYFKFLQSPHISTEVWFFGPGPCPHPFCHWSWRKSLDRALARLAWCHGSRAFLVLNHGESTAGPGEKPDMTHSNGASTAWHLQHFAGETCHNMSHASNMKVNKTTARLSASCELFGRGNSQLKILSNFQTELWLSKLLCEDPDSPRKFNRDKPSSSNSNIEVMSSTPLGACIATPIAASLVARQHLKRFAFPQLRLWMVLLSHPILSFEDFFLWPQVSLFLGWKNHQECWFWKVGNLLFFFCQSSDWTNGIDPRAISPGFWPPGNPDQPGHMPMDQIYRSSRGPKCFSLGSKQSTYRVFSFRLASGKELSAKPGPGVGPPEKKWQL